MCIGTANPRVCLIFYLRGNYSTLVLKTVHTKKLYRKFPRHMRIIMDFKMLEVLTGAFNFWGPSNMEIKSILLHYYPLYECICQI